MIEIINGEPTGGLLMRVILCVILGFMVVFSAPSVWGQNLASNPHFDTDVAGWSSGFESTVLWDPLDADGSMSSGSAMVTNLSTNAVAGDGPRQCIGGISGGTNYRVATDILIPGGQSETGQAYFYIRWYQTAACSGDAEGTVFSQNVTTSTPDAWYRVWILAGAPPGTQSVYIGLHVLKFEATGSLDAHFDNVEVLPVIFVDGFEDGTTDAWSGVTP